MEHLLKSGNKEELVEVINSDSLRGHSTIDMIMVVNTGSRRNGGIGKSVPVDEFTTALVEWRKVKIVGRGISRIGLLGVQEEIIVQVLVGEVGEAHNVLHVPQLATDAAFTAISKLAGEHGFASIGDMGINERLVDVDPVVIDLVQSVHLRASEAVRRLVVLSTQ